MYTTATVRDQLDFDALPENTKALARLVLAGAPAATQAAASSARIDGYNEGYTVGYAEGKRDTLSRLEHP